MANQLFFQAEATHESERHSTALTYDVKHESPFAWLADRKSHATCRKTQKRNLRNAVRRLRLTHMWLLTEPDGWDKGAWKKLSQRKAEASKRTTWRSYRESKVREWRQAALVAPRRQVVCYTSNAKRDKKSRRKLLRRTGQLIRLSRCVYRQTFPIWGPCVKGLWTKDVLSLGAMRQNYTTDEDGCIIADDSFVDFRPFRPSSVIQPMLEPIRKPTWHHCLWVEKVPMSLAMLCARTDVLHWPAKVSRVSKLCKQKDTQHLVHRLDGSVVVRPMQEAHWDRNKRRIVGERRSSERSATFFMLKERKHKRKLAAANRKLKKESDLRVARKLRTEAYRAKRSRQERYKIYKKKSRVERKLLGKMGYNWFGKVGREFRADVELLSTSVDEIWLKQESYVLHDIAHKADAKAYKRFVMRRNRLTSEEYDKLFGGDDHTANSDD